MTINRKIGLKTTRDNAHDWHVHQTSECWLSDKHNYVAFLWSEKIGKISQQSEEVPHYKNQLSQHEPSTDETYIFGAFTEWNPVKMIELIPFCIQNDLQAPEFVQ